MSARAASGEGAVEPISLLIAALAAGAAAGFSDVAKESVVSAYQRLRGAVQARLAGRAEGPLILERFEQAPETWEHPLRAELTAAGAVDDEALVAMARQVLAGIEKGNGPGPKYQTDFHGQVGGVVVGDAARIDVNINKPGSAGDPA
jgi:hypothetical protein